MPKPFWKGRNRWMLALALVATPAAASPGAVAGEPLGERESYAFARTVEGSVSVAPEGQGVGEELQRNQPLLTGDRVWADRHSRVELLLPDRNRLTLAGESSVRLERLAFSGDRESRVTILRLEDGEILLEVSEEALGDELPRVECGNATIYVQQPGLYRIRTGGDGWLELVTREGYAELVTARGSTIVRAGESAEAGADRHGRIQISQAGDFDDLEQWSVDVAQGANRGGASQRHLDASVDYAASDLDQNGSWVEVESVSYWRPRVAVGWRPYWDGRWAWTPSGYTWVSYEPWGWVPYHYGRWSLLPGYGWAWRPGAVYSPAWVYWHWSSGYAGWCPTGYYTDYYNPWYRGGFRWGYYGWAGGDWGHYNHWNFAPVHCFRNREFRGHMRRGPDLRREGRWPEAPRGLITTDTRDFRPDRIDHPDQLLHKIRDRELDSTRGELPDVTDFVGRKRDLPPTVAQAIVPGGPREPRLRIDTPKVDDPPAWRRECGTPDRRADGGQRDGAPAAGDSRVDPGSGGKSADESAASPRDVAGVTPGKPAEPGASETARDRTPTGREPRTSAPRTSAPTGGGDPRQGWKNQPSGTPTLSSGPRSAPAGNPADGAKSDPQLDSRSRTSAPVERVISGTRRAAPRPEDGSATTGKPPADSAANSRATSPGTPSRPKPIDTAPTSRSRSDGGNSASSGGGSSGGGYDRPSSSKPSVSRPPAETRSRSTTSAAPPSRSPVASGSPGSGSSTGKSTPATSASSSGSSGRSKPATSSGSGGARSGSSGGAARSGSSSSGGSKSSGSSSSGSGKSSGGGDQRDKDE